MLERAAGCFESAGRRFLRDAEGVFRTRRSLARHFWKHNVALGNISAWLPAILQLSDQTAASVPNRPHGHKSVNDISPPFLDFLYPRNAQELAVSELFRRSRRLGLRRRKKSLIGSSRDYSTEATNLEKILLDGRSAPLPKQNMPKRKRNNVARQAQGDLRRLLRGKGGECDKVWVLYLAAGRPQRYRKAVCKYLSYSTQISARDHAWQVFQEIPRGNRRFKDYRRITRSQLFSEQPCVPRLKSICVDAISRGLGGLPCAYVFEYYAKRADWINALDIWNVRSRLVGGSDREHLEIFFHRINRSSLASVAHDLGIFLAASPHDDNARELAETMLGKISTSYTALANTPMDVLLRFIEQYSELGLLNEIHYFNMVRTLQESASRQIFVRSVLLYHHLRQNLPGAKPPAKLLHGQLAGLRRFEIVDGVHFLLNELAHFWGKPSIEAYKQALVLFSRTADVQQVNAIFERLVADHGNPRSRRLLTPLLAVHARAGNVQETFAQFRRVAEEFRLEQNTTCWNILLKAYAIRNDPEGALRTFVQMIDYGVMPDSHTFGTLMGICANRGDIDGTRWLLKEAQRRSVRVTMPMLDTIAQVYCQNRRPDLAEQLARAAKRMKIKGSPTRMWNMILLQSVLRMDRLDYLRVRRYMKESRIGPDSMTLAARLLMLALKNKPEEARQTLRTMHKTRVIQATELHYSLVLLAYIRTRNRPMVRIVLNEALERFGNRMSPSGLSKLMAHVDHDLELVEKAENPESHEAELRLQDTEKSLIHSFGKFDRSVLADKFPFLKAEEKSSGIDLSMSQYEYLVGHYGTHGSIQETKEMFARYLKSRDTARSSENEPDIIPFRIVTVMMRAHMAADEFDKVEEFWRLALSNAIKIARPLRLDQYFAPTSLGPTTSAEPETLPTPSSNPVDVPVRPDISRFADSAPQKESSVLASKRFILSQPFSIYLRALAYQNKTDEISRAVNQLEAAGFEMSGTNWSVYVQMMAASDRQADIIEAFQVFEHKFMPKFPGWAPLKRGWAVKPETASGTTHLLEFDTLHYAHTQRHKYGSFLGRQARKHWRKLEPELLMPTYLTTVYLTAAINRVRAASIAAGKDDLTAIYDVAPKTVQTLAEMPIMRDKFQGTLIRGVGLRPDPPLQIHDSTIAFGGILGKGARARFNWDLRDPRIQPQDEPAGDHQPTEGRQQAENQQPSEGQQPVEGPRPVQAAQLMEEPKGLLNLFEGKWRRRWLRFPYIEPTDDNETVRLLAHILSPENSSGSRESLLSPEDRLDIESDIRFLATMRSLEQAKRLVEQREQAHREALATARKAEQSRPLTEIDEQEEFDDGFEADLEELESLGKLRRESLEAVDQPKKLDNPDIEESEDLFDEDEEFNIEASDLADDMDSIDEPDVEKSEQDGRANEVGLSDLEEPVETWGKNRHQDLMAIMDRARENDVNRQSEVKCEDAETSTTAKGKMR